MSGHSDHLLVDELTDPELAGLPFPTPPPTGTIQTSQLFAFQLAVIVGKVARYQPECRPGS